MYKEGILAIYMLNTPDSLMPALTFIYLSFHTPARRSIIAVTHSVLILLHVTATRLDRSIIEEKRVVLARALHLILLHVATTGLDRSIVEEKRVVLARALHLILLHVATIGLDRSIVEEKRVGLAGALHLVLRHGSASGLDGLCVQEKGVGFAHTFFNGGCDDSRDSKKKKGNGGKLGHFGKYFVKEAWKCSLLQAKVGFALFAFSVERLKMRFFSVLFVERALRSGLR